MEYVVLFLIVFGIIFILLGIINYVMILQNFNIIYKSIKFSNKRYISYFIFIILVSFLLLYLFYLNHIILTDIEYDYFIIFTSLLLFLGGVFVYIIILLLKNLFSSLENFHLQIVKNLVRFLTIRDKYTSRHSVHVADLIKLLWKHLPLRLKEKTSKNDLIQAALLHDIGKIMTPLHILNKACPLSLEEYEEMKKHTTNCTVILEHFPTFKDIISWIKYHHERIDGNGYHGLKEHEIPLESKIITVVDMYSALTTDRIYKKKVSHEEAIKILQEASGSQLDKEIVDSFIKIKKESLDEIDMNSNSEEDNL